MSFLLGLDYYHWLLAGLLLLVVEMLIGGGLLMWLGFSALGTGILVLVLPWFNFNSGWESQLVFFSIGCLVSVAVWWKYFHWSLPVGQAQLNRRGTEHVGQIVELKEPLENGRGHVMMGDTRWQIKGPDLPAGTRIRLVELDDMVFVAEPVSDADA